MAGETHLVLVGTSVLRNALGVAEGSRRPPEGCGAFPGECIRFLRVCADPRSRDPAACMDWLRSVGGVCLGYIECLVSRAPGEMSAELNAMDWVLGRGCRGVEEVVLYATDTPEGEAAARVLQAYLRGACRGAEVRVVRVGRLGRSPFWQGIIELMRQVARDAHQAYAAGRMVYLNATGGFKPESAAALMAAMAAAPVYAYYKHEAMRETVMLPYIPFSIDRGRLRALAGKLAALSSSPGAAVDPAEYPEAAWILDFLASTGAAKKLADGRVLVTEQAAEALKLFQEVYEELEKLLTA